MADRLAKRPRLTNSIEANGNGSRLNTSHSYAEISLAESASAHLGDIYIDQARISKESKCLQAFKTSTYEQFKDHNPSRAQDTCRWVLDDEQYRDWYSSDRSELLWISADPGCGKSVLSKALIEEILPSSTDSTVCYFFFKDNEQQDKLSTALCALLHQLFSREPALIQYGMSAWEENGTSLKDEVKVLWRVLVDAAATRSSGTVFCVIDALDECDEQGRKELIDLLCNFHTISKNKACTEAPLKFIVTSRPYDNVSRWFKHTTKNFPHIRLRGEDKNDAIHQEIDIVIHQNLSQLKDEFDLSEDVTLKVTNKLLQMHNRTYLWLYLVVEDIRERFQRSINLAEEEIELLPHTVQAAYEQILGKVVKSRLALVRKVLLLVVGARRPLTIRELAMAMGVALMDDRFFGKVVNVDSHQLQQQLRDWCGCFVYFNHSRIHLIHQTAKEFLISDLQTAQSDTLSWSSSFTISEVETQMCEICVGFLLMVLNVDVMQASALPASVLGHRILDPCFAPEFEDSTKQIFYEFCAEHWSSYFYRGTLPENHSLTNGALALYLASPATQQWFQTMYKAINPYQAVPLVSPCHVAAFNDHDSIFELLYPVAAPIIDEPDTRHDTVLMMAAERGSVKAVSWLCKRGADVNQTSRGWNALCAASKNGHLAIVKELLQSGADPNASPDFFNSAISLAAYRGHTEIVELLLVHGADCNLRGVDGPPLYAAAEQGHEKIVAALLAAGASPADIGIAGDALSAATVNGHEQVFKLLFETGAYVKLEDTWRRAIDSNHFRTLETTILSCAGSVNVELPPALNMAAKFGDAGLLRSLIKQHTFRRDSLNTALCMACFAGHSGCSRILLAAGADANCSSGRPLVAAVQARSFQCMEILLASGADVNILGPHCDELTTKLFRSRLDGLTGSATILTTALCTAIFEDDSAIVRWLLDHGASMTHGHVTVGDVLHFAGRRASVAVIRLLLRHIAEPAVHDADYSFELAIRDCLFGVTQKIEPENCDDVVRYLIENYSSEVQSVVVREVTDWNQNLFELLYIKKFYTSLSMVMQLVITTLVQTPHIDPIYFACAAGCDDRTILPTLLSHSTPLESGPALNQALAIVLLGERTESVDVLAAQGALIQGELYKETLLEAVRNDTDYVVIWLLDQTVTGLTVLQFENLCEEILWLACDSDSWLVLESLEDARDLDFWAKCATKVSLTAQRFSFFMLEGGPYLFSIISRGDSSREQELVHNLLHTELEDPKDRIGIVQAIISFETTSMHADSQGPLTHTSLARLEQEQLLLRRADLLATIASAKNKFKDRPSCASVVRALQDYKNRHYS